MWTNQKMWRNIGRNYLSKYAELIQVLRLEKQLDPEKDLNQNVVMYYLVPDIKEVICWH